MVSNDGEVKSIDRIIDVNGVKRFVKGVVLKKQLNKHGYWVVILSKNNVHKRQTVHRLVAKAFIPNPFNKPCTDHIDGVRTNNNVSNLRWATVQENNTFPLAFKHHCECRIGFKHNIETKAKLSKSLIGNSRRSISVTQLTLDGDILNEWDSAKKASINTNTSHSKIIACCKNKRKQSGGFKWKYTE